MSKNSPIQLYNTEEQEWRKGNFQRGDSWRSKEVYECGVCGTQTNRWMMGGYPGMGPRHWCEGGAYTEHDDIEHAQEEVTALDKRIEDYAAEVELSQIAGSTRAAVRDLLAHLQVERELLQTKIDRLRSIFAKKVLHNVEGTDGDVTPIRVWFSSRLGGKKRSLLTE